MVKALIVLVGLVATAVAFPHRIGPNGLPVRIVGGEEAIPNEFPWQTSLQYFGSHLCGASIVNPTTLITAAHCAEVAPASSFTVQAGRHNLFEFESTQQMRQVSSFVIHPGYPGLSGYSNDIAIVKLTQPLNFNAFVGPVPIAPSLHTATGDATIAGWGGTREDGPVVATLRKVDVPIVTDTQCRVAYGGLIDDSMICAGLPAGGKDSCQGDSGGPLLATDLGTGYYLAGIVSFGNGCARPGYPGVYAEISHFTEFINSNA